MTAMRRSLALVAAVAFSSGTALAQQTPPDAAAAAQPTASGADVAADDEERALEIAIKPWKGDFQQMLERKRIRVLVPYGRTLYFNDKGAERGLSVENVRDFERYINRKYVKDKRPVMVLILPTTRDKLLSQVAAGMGDIAAGNLTVTEARRKTVDFVAPDDYRTVDELIVTGAGAPELKTIDDLSGKTVAARPTTSQYESLQALNRRFAAQKKRPITIQQLPVALEGEDILEMTNAGILDIVVVDDWMADLWAQVMPNIKVRKDLVVRDEGRTGWAIRKGSPGLHAAIMDFYRENLVKQGVAAYRLTQYSKKIKQIQNPSGGDGREALRADHRAIPQVWRRVQLRPTDDGGAGLPGVPARPECQEPRGSDRRHAGHAGDGQGTWRGRHPTARAQHPRRREVHGPAHVAILQGREV